MQRIVIAEDHLMFREALRKACVEFGHAVVGEAGDGRAALKAVFAVQPDILLLDLSLPVLDGFGVVQALRAAALPTKVIALTAATAEYTLFRIEKAGIQGFVDKGTNSLDALREAIVAVAAGRTCFSPEFQRVTTARKRNPISFDKVLSAREREVLRLIGHSRSDAEIAGELGISARTVGTFRQHIMDKLDIHGTPKLIRFAIERGFTDVPAAAPDGGAGKP